MHIVTLLLEIAKFQSFEYKLGMGRSKPDPRLFRLTQLELDPKPKLKVVNRRPKLEIDLKT